MAKDKIDFALAMIKDHVVNEYLHQCNVQYGYVKDDISEYAKGAYISDYKIDVVIPFPTSIGESEGHITVSIKKKLLKVEQEK